MTPSSADLGTTSSVIAPTPQRTGERSHRLIRALELVLALLSLAAGGYVFATTVLMVVDSWTAVPLSWDQWWSGIFFSDQPFFTWLIGQHNEHRIAFPRLLFTIDRIFFAATNKFTFGFNLASQLSLALLVTYIASRTEGQRICERIWLAGAAVALLFSAMQYENFLWGFQVAFPGVALAAVATFAALVLGRVSVWTLFAVIGLESIAVHSLASGLLVPFLAVALALWLRWPMRYVMVLSVAAFALVGSFFYGYVPPPGVSDAAGAIRQPRELFSSLLALIGLPFGMMLSEAHVPHPRNWERFCGGAGLALLAIAMTSMLRRRERGGPTPVLGAAALFALGMAVMTALGRLKGGTAQAMLSRYSTVVLLFWLSLIVVATIRLRPLDARLRVAGMAAILPLLLGLAYYQPSFTTIGHNWVLPRLEGTTALLAKVNDSTALASVFYDNTLMSRAPFLRDRHLSIFADEWSDWLGTALAAHVRLVDPAQCRGGIDGIGAVDAAGPDAWRTRGWVWDRNQQTVPRRIVIADASGRVLGYGLSGFPRTGEGGDWRGHFTMPPPVSIVAYALLENGRTACPLGAWPLGPK
jgi:hypothetical protein